MKKCCWTCTHYTPTFFGYYKGEVCEGMCDIDDLCAPADDFCKCYEPIGLHIPSHTTCCDSGEPPF